MSLSVFCSIVLFLTTPEIFMESKLKHLIAWSLGAIVKHKNIANLCENVCRSQSVRVGFLVNKSNHLSKILSCNVPWQDWPNIINLFEKSAYERWFSKWDITY